MVIIPTAEPYNTKTSWKEKATLGELNTVEMNTRKGGGKKNIKQRIEGCVYIGMQDYFAETSDGAMEIKKSLPFNIDATKLQTTQLPIWPVPAAFPTGTTIINISLPLY